MKLLSTEIGENSIELVYADNPNADDATQLVVVRMPIEGDELNTLAYARATALQQAFDFLRVEVQRLHNAMRR